MTLALMIISIASKPWDLYMRCPYLESLYLASSIFLSAASARTPGPV